MRDYLNVVENILKNHADARDDDFRLYGWVCKKVCPDVMNLQFKQVLWQNKELDLPTYETITRCRRKLQEKHPEYRGKKYNRRMEEQENYISTFSRY